jgi:succinate dehydrogenase/fumarate reductase iron-sulfur protein
LRYDRESEEERYQTYDVPKSPDMSVMDALAQVNAHIDGSLAVNHSCGKQRCGSCAMKIDGKIGLACYTPVKDEQVVSPLPGFKVVKDLVVDWQPYEDRMYSLIPKEGQGPLPDEELPESKDKDRAEEAMTCIRCFACVGACPSVDLANPKGFAGPAASVMLATYLDSPGHRRELAEPVLNAGLEFCTKCFACNAVCPADIDIVASINRLQKVTANSRKEGKDLVRMLQGYS